MSWINAPICERCWIERNSEWEPVRLTEPEIEMCNFCGSPTIFGAYVRAEVTS